MRAELDGMKAAKKAQSQDRYQAEIERRALEHRAAQVRPCLLSLLTLNSATSDLARWTGFPQVRDGDTAGQKCSVGC